MPSLRRPAARSAARPRPASLPAPPLARLLAPLLAALLAALAAPPALAQPPDRTHWSGTLGSDPVELDLRLPPPGADGPAAAELAGGGRPVRFVGAVEALDEATLRLALEAEPPRGDPPPDGFPHPVRLELLVSWPRDRARGELSGDAVDAAGGTAPLRARSVAAYAVYGRRLGRVEAETSYPVFLPEALDTGELARERAEEGVEAFYGEGLEGLRSGGMASFGWGRHAAIELHRHELPVVSLLERASVYTGGAHPALELEAVNLFVTDEGATPLSLFELFAEPDAAEARVSELVLADLRRQGASWVTDGSIARLGWEGMAAWTLAPDGLRFHFEPYLVGPYAEGSFEAFVPFAALREHLNPHGELGRLLGAP